MSEELRFPHGIGWYKSVCFPSVLGGLVLFGFGDFENLHYVAQAGLDLPRYSDDRHVPQCTASIRMLPFLLLTTTGL